MAGKVDNQTTCDVISGHIRPALSNYQPRPLRHKRPHLPMASLRRIRSKIFQPHPGWALAPSGVVLLVRPSWDGRGITPVHTVFIPDFSHTLGAGYLSESVRKSVKSVTRALQENDINHALNDTVASKNINISTFVVGRI